MKKWFLFTVSLIVFIIVSIHVYFGKTSTFDLFLYNIIINLKNDYVTNFFKTIITFSFLLYKNKKFFLFLFIDMISIVLLNYILKLTFLRERPFDLMIINEKGYSYPSGHSMVAVSFYGFIIYLIWKMKIKKTYKYILTFIIASLIILIGISRIYLGVHFPSDIIGGYSISLCFLITYIALTEKRIV